MDAWRRYSRARDQIYHVGVVWRTVQDRFPAKHRTPELLQVLEIIETIIAQAQASFEAGELMAVQIDRYTAIPLPGFEDYDAELKKPHWNDEA